jgi:acyl-CoA synthetase (AMP-forming)/AMP-acid ligase II
MRQKIATGELAFVNSDGFFFLKGRLDDMIVSGGVNVFPADLEQVLFEHPATSEAVAIGIPDADFGERLNAFVVSNLSEKEIMDWLRPRAARFQLPKTIVIVDEIPLMETRKVDRKALRNIWIRRQE